MCLAEFHVVRDLVHGRLLKLFPDYQALEEDPIQAVFAGRRLMRPRVQLFLDFLRAEFGDTSDWRASVLDRDL